MHFIWKEEYIFNIKEIDKQHQCFIGILDSIYDSIFKNLSREEMAVLLQSLIDYTVNHFSTEEKYFIKFDYPEAKEHIVKHEELKTKVLAFQKDFKEGKSDISIGLIDFLEDWLVDHLLTTDKKYVEYFHEHGLY